MFGRKDDNGSASGMPENVVVLERPAQPSAQPRMIQTINEIVASGNYLRQHEKEIVENQKVLARIAHAKFVAYKEAGFSHEDALTLCIRSA